MLQKTIAQSIHCTGVGLHSGKKVSMTLRPALEDTGIVFRLRTPGGIRDISPAPEAVVATSLATTLGRDGVAVSTVEHLLAALRGLEIDNVRIEVEGGEVPVMDGSAAPFVMLFAKAGLRVQNRARKVLRIKRPVNFSRDGKSIQAAPYDGFFVDYEIKFPHPAIGVQRLCLDLNPESFAKVAKARTFGFLRDVEMLQKRGQALGGSLDNAVVLDERGVLNQEGLRHSDEFVRHKILDFIGDMAMLPLPLHGRFSVSCSGHSLNNDFLRHIVSAADLYLESAYLGEKRQPAPLPPCRASAEEAIGVHAFAG